VTGMRRIVLITVLAALTVPAGTAWASQPNPNPGAVPESNLQESVHAIYADRAVLALNTNNAVIPLEEEYTEGGRTTVRLSSDVLFDFGKATLTDTARDRLAEIAKKLSGVTGQVLVTGHTDSVGSPQANLRLSRQRAEAVKAQLEKALGGAGVEVVARGRGESKPVEPNTKNGEDNPAGRAKNRRVDITYGQ
jgi:OmpA-OmpF porin, OOP family